MNSNDKITFTLGYTITIEHNIIILALFIFTIYYIILNAISLFSE